MDKDRFILMYFYLTLGFVFQFPSVAMRFWLIETVKLTPAQMMGLMGVIGIPWCLKPIYGFISDSFPIMGYRRKPYVILGCIISTVSYWTLPWYSDNLDWVMFFLVFTSLGCCVADVVCDSILVEYARAESEEERGTIQSYSWGARALGGLIASCLGGVTYDWVGAELVFIITGLLPLIIMLLFLLLNETKVEVRVSGNAKTTMHQLWKAFKNKDIYKPALFLFIVNVTPGYGAVTSYFFENVLKFNAIQFSILDVTSYVSALIGTVIYKKYLTQIPIRRILFWTLLLSWVLKWSYMVLIQRWNIYIGIPDIWFALADSVILTLIGQCILMPIVVLGARICPPGVEGSLYATLMSINNFAGVMSSEWGSALANMYGVNRDHFDNFWKLIVLCNMIDLIPIATTKLIHEPERTT